MTFVITDDNRDRMNDFAQLMTSVFPGSVLYLYTEPMEVIGCLRDHQVDAVFAEAAMEEMEGVQLLFELRERVLDQPMFILADSDEYEDAAMWNDATGYLIRPISEEDLLLNPEELEAVDIIRKGLNGLKPEEAVENILNMFDRTRTNSEFVQTVKKTRLL